MLVKSPNASRILKITRLTKIKALEKMLVSFISYFWIKSWNQADAAKPLETHREYQKCISWYLLRLNGWPHHKTNRHIGLTKSCVTLSQAGSHLGVFALLAITLCIMSSVVPPGGSVNHINSLPWVQQTSRQHTLSSITHTHTHTSVSYHTGQTVTHRRSQVFLWITSR